MSTPEFRGHDPKTLLDAIAVIAREAGEVILPYYREEIVVDDKQDGSPVTAADRAADALIVPALRALTPNIPVVSEESVEAGDIPDVSGGVFWLVDPLDGTKEFINKRDDFTVNIGLISNGKPVLGVLLTPVDGVLSAGALGLGAWEEAADGTRTPISVSAAYRQTSDSTELQQHPQLQLPATTSQPCSATHARAVEIPQLWPSDL